MTSKRTARDSGSSRERCDLAADLDGAAERLEVGAHRVGDRRRAAARDRPADGVAERQQHERERGRPGRVRAGASRARPCRRTAPAPAACESAARASQRRRHRAAAAEARRRAAARLRRARERARARTRRAPPSCARTGRPASGRRASSAAEAGGGLLERARERRRRSPSSSGCAACDRRLDQLEAELLERQRRAGTASRRASGCTAEQTSWRNPGSVSSACGCRRRSWRRPRSDGPSGRCGRARSRRRARWGRPPTTTASSKHHALGSARRRAATASAAGAPIMCRPERIPALCQTFAARDHWRRRSTQTRLRRSTSAVGAEMRGQRGQRVHPVRVLLAVSAERHPDLVERIARRASAPAPARSVAPSSTNELNVIQPANMWPCGVISVNDSSSANSTSTPVDSFSPPGIDEVERRDLARRDPGERREEAVAGRPELGEVLLPRRDHLLGVARRRAKRRAVGLLPHPAEAVHRRRRAAAGDVDVPVADRQTVDRRAQAAASRLVGLRRSWCVAFRVGVSSPRRSRRARCRGSRSPRRAASARRSGGSGR